MTSTRALPLLLSLLAVGCDSGSTVTDAGPPDLGNDTGASDAGEGLDSGPPPSDAGPVDAGSTDSSIPDAAASDAGPSGPAALCTSTGGTVGTASCCTSTSDFPNMCGGIGACGCSPTYSHSVQVCECPASTCFDRTMGCR